MANKRIIVSRHAHYYCSAVNNRHIEPDELVSIIGNRLIEEKQHLRNLFTFGFRLAHNESYFVINVRIAVR